MDDPAPTPVTRHPFHLVLGALLLLLIWGGGGALAWSEWTRSPELLAATPAVRADLRTVHLEDALAVTVVILLILSGLVLMFRRRGPALAGAVWSLVAVGLVLGFVAVATMPGEDLYTSCGNGREDQIVEDAGWSWTRFSEVMVVTDPRGSRVTTCSR